MQLIVHLHGKPLHRFPLGSRPLEIGTDLRCDIVIDDPELKDRSLLVQLIDGDTILTWMDRKGEKPKRLPIDRSTPISALHALEPVYVEDRIPERTRTEHLPPGISRTSATYLAVGRGNERRKYKLSSRPFVVGSSKECDLRIFDRCVSAKHFRIERSQGGVVLRDLGSRNGTFVDGMRVYCSHLSPGARIRVGNTDLEILDEGDEQKMGAMVVASSEMKEVLRSAERYASLPWPVLIHGASGSGKEGVARWLHELGARKSRPFLALNVAALPDHLVESELFGHEKGAFTSADRAHRGLFEQAEDGTLFLDEIGELSSSIQSKLLRTLESGEVRRVGSESAIRFHARIVCATHRNLHDAVRDGLFREDLYFRLVQLRIFVPNLVQRRSDILPLAHHFLKTVSREVGNRELTNEASQALQNYAWPGNVRELRNVVRSAAAHANGPIHTGEIERAIQSVGGVAWGEKEIDLAEIRDSYRSISDAARKMGLPRSTLRDRIKRLEANEQQSLHSQRMRHR